PLHPPSPSTLSPHATLFRSHQAGTTLHAQPRALTAMASSLRYIGLMSGTSMDAVDAVLLAIDPDAETPYRIQGHHSCPLPGPLRDRKSTRLNSSHVKTSYAV